MPRKKKIGAKRVLKKKISKRITKKKIDKKLKVKFPEKKIIKDEQTKTLKAYDYKNAVDFDGPDYVKLVKRLRRAKRENTINKTFEEILFLVDTKIKRIVNRFNIPGLTKDDIYQEALFALRYKAIKDYDHKRGPFDRFAILCIRRHLATEFKVSLQNKKKVLNSSVSLNQDNNGDDNDLSLINIVCSEDGNVLDKIEDKEHFNLLIGKLYGSLSKLEKQVFRLYAKKFSYEEISMKINEDSNRVIVDIKSVDNALSRIKNKAKTILEQIKFEEDETY